MLPARSSCQYLGTVVSPRTQKHTEPLGGRRQDLQEVGQHGDEPSSCSLPPCSRGSWGNTGVASSGCWAGATGRLRWGGTPLGPGGPVPRRRLQLPSASLQASTIRRPLSCWMDGGSSWNSGESGHARQGAWGQGLWHLSVIAQCLK